MLDDVEQPDGVKFVDKWNAPCVHLHQADRVDARARKLQPLEESLAATDGNGRMSARNRGEHRARTAADFEEGAASAGIAPERPEDQASARAKPEVVALQRVQRFKILG